MLLACEGGCGFPCLYSARFWLFFDLSCRFSVCLLSSILLDNTFLLKSLLEFPARGRILFYYSYIFLKIFKRLSYAFNLFTYSLADW